MSMPEMSLETRRSLVREGFRCHFKGLDSMLRMTGSYFKLDSGHSTMETKLEKDKIRDSDLFIKPRDK